MFDPATATFVTLATLVALHTIVKLTLSLAAKLPVYRYKLPTLFQPSPEKLTNSNPSGITSMTNTSPRIQFPGFITVIVNSTNSPTLTEFLFASFITTISGTLTTVVLLEFAFAVALLVKLEPAITFGMN